LEPDVVFDTLAEVFDDVFEVFAFGRVQLRRRLRVNRFPWSVTQYANTD
jgi:hypothetical protein